jgi:UDP-3-O-acyl-N-acetylglucosamine deacetylase
MTFTPSDGTLIYGGDAAALAYDAEALSMLPVDEERRAPEGWEPPRFESTVATETTVEGRGTYDKRARRTLRFLPSTASGWRFQRADLPGAAAIPVALSSVRSASRALLLGAGEGDANCMGMAEHIIAHRLGLCLSNLTVEAASYDPPLFNVGSMEIVEALQAAGMREDTARPLPTLTVKQPVAILRPGGSGFLYWEPPATAGDRQMRLDVAVDFPTAIGRQRIQFDLCPQAFVHGAHARTNCAASEVLLARTIGWLIPKYRNFGYTRDNILIAGRKRYRNTPGLLLPNGKSLEAVWHRACLDLVAALSLLPHGWPCGRFVSYKGGHVLDVEFLTRLQREGLLQTL